MTASSDLLSIVIPAYNVERYVRAAIDSALAQRDAAVEVLVIDDGSTDGTGAIADSFGDSIRVVHQPNRGLAGARNTGIAHASGTYLGWLDADDVWFPERAAQCIAFLRQRPEVAAVTTDALLIDDETPSSRRYYRDHLAGGFPAPDRQLATIIDHNFMFVGAVVRASKLRRHGGFDETLRRSEDYDLWMRMLLEGEQFALIDEPLAAYRLRSDSLSADAAAQWEAHLSVVDRHFDAIRARGLGLGATVANDLSRRSAASGNARRAAAYSRAAMRATAPTAVRSQVRLATQWLTQLCHTPFPRV